MGNARSSAYSDLWGIVDGAVSDAFNSHPDYLTAKGLRSARTSVVKRVTGTVLGFATQAAKGRLQPAETPVDVATHLPAGEGVSSALPTFHRVRIGRITLKRACSSRKLVEFNDTLNRLRRAQEGRGQV